MGGRPMISERPRIEILAWAAVTIVAWAASAHFHVADTIGEFARAFEPWQLDEFLTLSQLLSVSALIVSLLQSRGNLQYSSATEHQPYDAARFDALTKLPNRHLFLELAGGQLGEAWRSGKKCSVLFLGLESFERFNDRFGHAVGDQLVIAVSDRLQRSSLNDALVARIGGDEFAILVADAGRDEAMLVANKVLAQLQRPFAVSGHEVSINANIGIGIGPDSGKRAGDLSAAAGRALYAAKRAGRGTVRIFEPLKRSEEGELPT